MPIYEYGCIDCGSRFEKLVKISHGGIEECPKCGSKNVKKAFSTFGIGGCPNTKAFSTFGIGGCPNTGSSSKKKELACGEESGNCCAGCKI